MRIDVIQGEEVQTEDIFRQICLAQNNNTQPSNSSVSAFRSRMRAV
jgi:hypothetical protein